MIKFLAVFVTMASLALPARAAQPGSMPILALWEYDGWAAPTAERPLGLRFALWAYRLLGRRGLRFITEFVAAYFFVTGREARQVVFVGHGLAQGT